MASGLLLQVVLILLNAFFAASEIAVISLNENIVRRQAEEGDKKAAKMLRMVSEPTGFLSTIQVGITLAGFLGSAFAADNFSSVIVDWLIRLGVTAISPAVLDTLSVIAITLILSYFTLICGELVPKRIAMRNPEKLARGVCDIILAISVVMKPVVWFLSVSTNAVLRLFRINPNEEEEPVSEEDIRMMIDIGEEKGTIEAEEREMIDNIFEFNNTSAGEVMIHRTDMVVIYIDDSHEDILRTIVESGYSRFPVCGENADDVLGILRTREYLLNAQSEQPKPMAELLHSAYFVPESVRADSLFRDMKKQKKHMAIVIDEFGGTAGLVTLEDLLEEIVGNIYDETDKKEEPDIEMIDENTWRAGGNCPIDVFCAETGFAFAEEEELEFTTLGGFIFSQLGIVPKDGSTPEVTVDRLRLRVLAVADHRIEQVQIERMDNVSEADSDAE
ncbi:MAG: HlyC/CorC family transporter [Clostridia bacterium]|nr:HlyC/CorC family transporter [Clostridia bacterium]